MIRAADFGVRPTCARNRSASRRLLHPVSVTSSLMAYARLDAPGRYVPAARLLLEYGADPNAGFLWDGLPSPFTALTGASSRPDEPLEQPDEPGGDVGLPGVRAVRARGVGVGESCQDSPNEAIAGAQRFRRPVSLTEGVPTCGGRVDGCCQVVRQRHPCQVRSEEPGMRSRTRAVAHWPGRAAGG